ncbi:MAG: WYL domain-containing protein [Lachnospiraceae bacterium]|nr:WYL domain-containing protein [Lachnospiraceae bacterium]
MELFSEIYNCYYQVLRHLLCSQTALTLQQIRGQICKEGFAESMLSVIPKLEQGDWNLFQKDGELFYSKLSSPLILPVSGLQKSYLKALLSDPRMQLFLNQKQIESLGQMLSEVPPLWTQEQFFYCDRFTDGDPYEDETYRQNFRTLLTAQKNRQYADIDYNSPKGTRVHHHYVPARLEYSVKNDKFRLLALKDRNDHRMKLEILNISRIHSVRLTNRTLDSQVDLNGLIQNSYYREPLKLHIVNKRNALERAMLHFANYEKNTTKIDETTYECLIYYNQTMETELLIEVMSFGPMLTVVGNEKFLKSLKERLQRQRNQANGAASFR